MCCCTALGTGLEIYWGKQVGLGWSFVGESWWDWFGDVLRRAGVTVREVSVTAGGIVLGIF